MAIPTECLTFHIHMKKSALLLAFASLLCIHAFPAIYYVAVDGNDKNPGTIDKPFATVQRAQKAVDPGDTVYIRGGTYHMTEDQIAHKERIYACVTYLDKSGEPGKYIFYCAYPGERPVFEYSAVK